jgi:hypothetical protein
MPKTLPYYEFQVQKGGIWNALLVGIKNMQFNIYIYIFLNKMAFKWLFFLLLKNNLINHTSHSNTFAYCSYRSTLWTSLKIHN